MAIGTGSGFLLKAQSYLDDRQSVDSLDDLKNISPYDIPEGFMCYEKTTESWYIYRSSNPTSTTTGQFAKIEFGASSEGIKIYIDYSKFPTILHEDTLLFAKNEYEDVDNSVVYGSGLYLWDNEKTKYIYLDAIAKNCSLSEELTTNVEVGGIEVNKTYTVDTKFETMWRDLLIKHFPPKLTLTNISTDLIVEKGTTINPLTIDINVTKTTNDVTEIKLYVDDVLKETKNLTTNPTIGDGGDFVFTYSEDINDTAKIKIVATDGEKEEFIEKTINFVSPIYVGSVNGGVTKEIRNKGNYVYKNITFIDDRIVFKYDKSYGQLVSILDENGFEVISSYNLTEEVINGINYYVYTLNNPCTLDNFTTTFKFNK